MNLWQQHGFTCVAHKYATLVLIVSVLFYQKITLTIIMLQSINTLYLPINGGQLWDIYNDGHSRNGAY